MKTLLTIIIPLCCFSCSSQDFEGIISYKTTYTSKIDGVSATEMFGQEVAYDLVCTNLEVTKLPGETFAIPKEGNLIKFEY